MFRNNSGPTNLQAEGLLSSPVIRIQSLLQPHFSQHMHMHQLTQPCEPAPEQPAQLVQALCIWCSLQRAQADDPTQRPFTARIQASKAQRCTNALVAVQCSAVKCTSSAFNEVKRPCNLWIHMWLAALFHLPHHTTGRLWPGSMASWSAGSPACDGCLVPLRPSTAVAVPARGYGADAGLPLYVPDGACVIC